MENLLFENGQKKKSPSRFSVRGERGAGERGVQVILEETQTG